MNVKSNSPQATPIYEGNSLRQSQKICTYEKLTLTDVPGRHAGWQAGRFGMLLQDKPYGYSSIIFCAGPLEN